MSHMKLCRACDTEKDLDEFYSDKSKSDGKQTQCKRCQSRRARTYYSNNKESYRLRRDNERDKYNAMLRRYGLSGSEYEEMLVQSGGKCAICKEQDNLYIDHDHSNGEVRGLLCHRCNTGLGLMRDSIENLEKAIHYLNQTRLT